MPLFLTLRADDGEGLAVTFAEWRDRRKILDIESYTKQAIRSEVIPGLEPKNKPDKSAKKPFGDSRKRGFGDSRGKGAPRGDFKGGPRGAQAQGDRRDDRFAGRSDDRQGKPPGRSAHTPPAHHAKKHGKSFERSGPRIIA